MRLKSEKELTLSPKEAYFEPKEVYFESKEAYIQPKEAYIQLKRHLFESFEEAEEARGFSDATELNAKCLNFYK